MSDARRLDVLLVERGFAETRAKAQAAIAAGGVTVDGAVAYKASATVRGDAVIVCQQAHPYVSRGGVKLAAALDAFLVNPRGKHCLDIGASTGGFSDVLLQRGAAFVVAVDVGRDQLHASLRANPMLRVLEERDARTLTAADFAAPPEIIVCDASFIALEKILPTPLSLAAARCDLVVLIKPQFEAGREVRRDKRGLIEDGLALQIAKEAAQRLDGLEGFRLNGFIESPIRGGEGALEGLAHLRRGD